MFSLYKKNSHIIGWGAQTVFSCEGQMYKCGNLETMFENIFYTVNNPLVVYIKYSTKLLVKTNSSSANHMAATQCT